MLLLSCLWSGNANDKIDGNSSRRQKILIILIFTRLFDGQLVLRN